MTMEMSILAYSVILGLLQIFAVSGAATMKYGLMYNMGPRDQEQKPLTGVAGRLSRTSKNFLETFPFFAAAVLAVEAMHLNSAHTVLGAELYFGARIVYIPLYLLGVPGLRTLVWAVSLVGIGMLLSTVMGF